MRHPHDQWEVMANVLIESGKYFTKETFRPENGVDELWFMRFCMQNQELSQNICKWLAKLNEPTKRTLKLTNEFRAKGNAVFDKVPGQNDLAADYYTKAIFSAPKDSVELALAHANRAACSVTSDRFYEEGYFDCKLALRYHYPEEKLMKLFDRKDYLANLTDKSEEYRMETYLEMRNLNFELDDDKITFLKIYECTRVKEIQHDNTNQNQKQTHAQSNGNQNLIEKYDPSVGRYQITCEAINENEQVYSERAFSFVPVLSEKINYSCQCCGKTSCLPFPCNNCSRASYCTPLCLNDHFHLHKYECVGYQKNLWMKVGLGYLAFHTSIVGFKDLVNRLINLKRTTVQQVWSTLTTGIPENYFLYGDILRLVTHLDKMHIKLILKHALKAQMLTLYLSEYTDFFTTLPNECTEIMSDIDDWKILVATTIMRHSCQAQFNYQKTYEINLQPPSDLEKSYGYGSYNLNLDDLHSLVSADSFFSAFFPKYSLFNHSCDPNTRIQINGPILSMYACRDIGKNKEIYTCYGPHYKMEQTIDRQRYCIDQYLFICNCDKCESNDTTFKKYYEYYCPNENCRSYVEVNDYCRWWYHLLSYDFCKRIDEQFICKKCNTRLPLDTDQIRKFVNSQNGHINYGNSNYTQYSEDTDGDIITQTLLVMYFNLSTVLGKYHEIKADMAESILEFNTLGNDNNFFMESAFPRLAYVAMEYFVNYLERYGKYSLAFVLATTRVLKLLNTMKIVERNNTSPIMARDIAKIRTILDSKTMEEAFSILSKPVQIVFKNALKEVNTVNNNVNGFGIASESVDNTVTKSIICNGVTSNDSEKCFG